MNRILRLDAVCIDRAIKLSLCSRLSVVLSGGVLVGGGCFPLVALACKTCVALWLLLDTHALGSSCSTLV
jgi:hypothetical protein